MTILTRSDRAPTPEERLAAYYTNPQAIQRRTFRLWPWQRQKVKAEPGRNVFQIPKRKRA